MSFEPKENHTIPQTDHHHDFISTKKPTSKNSVIALTSVLVLLLVGALTIFAIQSNKNLHSEPPLADTQYPTYKGNLMVALKRPLNADDLVKVKKYAHWKDIKSKPITKNTYVFSSSDSIYSKPEHFKAALNKATEDVKRRNPKFRSTDKKGLKKTDKSEEQLMTVDQAKEALDIAVATVNADLKKNVETTSNALKQNLNDYLFIEPDYQVSADATIDPYFIQQWYLNNTGQSISSNRKGDTKIRVGVKGADIKYTKSEDIVNNYGKDMTVAVMDTGVYYWHDDLGICDPSSKTCESTCKYQNASEPTYNCKVIEGYDFLDHEPNAADDEGHGTHVAGIIAANKNDKGIVGVCPNCKILPLKVLDESGNGSYSAIVEAIDYAISKKVDVVNASLGGPVKSEILQAAIKRLNDAGIVFVAAAGNSGVDEKQYPAAFDEPISVAASDYNDKLAFFSTYNSTVDIMAPGHYIFSTIAPFANEDDQVIDNYDMMSGTSMATPVISGVVALTKSYYKSKGINLTPNQLKAILYNGTDQVLGQDTLYGAGRVNLEKIVKNSAAAYIKFSDFTVDDSNSKLNNGVLDAGEQAKINFNVTPVGFDANRLNIVFTKSPDYDLVAPIDKSINLNNVTHDVTVPVNGVVEFKAKSTLKAGQPIKVNFAVIYLNNSNRAVTFYKSILVDISEDTSFPKYTTTYENQISDVLVSDLDNDGKNETVVLYNYYGLKIFDESGYLKAFFKYPEAERHIITRTSDEPMAIGDIDSDGFKEIVIRSWQDKIDGGYLFALDHNAKLKKGYPMIFRNNMLSSPLLADLDGDGKQEIVLTDDGFNIGYNPDLIASHGEFSIVKDTSDGPKLIKKRTFITDEKKWDTLSKPAVGDFNNDGKKDDIAFLSTYYGDPKKVTLYIVNNKGDNLVDPVDVTRNKEGGALLSSVVAGDVDNDGKDDIVFAINQLDKDYYFDDTSIYAMTSKGKAISGWPIRGYYGAKIEELFLADVDTDKKLEIITKVTSVGYQGKNVSNGLNVFNSSGKSLPDFPLYVYQDSGEFSNDRDRFPDKILFTDINGDGKSEIVTNLKGSCELYALDSKAKYVSGFPKKLTSGESCFIKNFFIAQQEGKRKLAYVTVDDNDTDRYSMKLDFMDLPATTVKDQIAVQRYDLTRTNNYNMLNITVPTPPTTKKTVIDFKANNITSDTTQKNPVLKIYINKSYTGKYVNVTRKNGGLDSFYSVTLDQEVKTGDMISIVFDNDTKKDPMINTDGDLFVVNRDIDLVEIKVNGKFVYKKTGATTEEKSEMLKFGLVYDRANREGKWTTIDNNYYDKISSWGDIPNGFFDGTGLTNYALNNIWWNGGINITLK